MGSPGDLSMSNCKMMDGLWDKLAVNGRENTGKSAYSTVHILPTLGVCMTTRPTLRVYMTT